MSVAAKPRLPIIGHRARWQALARAFENGAIPQTLLISGAPQVGKWTLARHFAQLLLCPSQVRDEESTLSPCGVCRACHQVEIGTFPDFAVFRPLVSSSEDEREWVAAPEMMQGSIVSVHQARKFAGEAMKKPLSGPRKVMILVQADRMNDEAQNCLLKTFEEPIPGLCIILLCDNADELKATIRSRCWHLPLGLSSDEDIASWLRDDPDFAAQGAEHIPLAVRAAGGRPGTAWREMRRLASAPESTLAPRFSQASELVKRIEQSQPVAALALTEEALKLSKQWWDEDLAASGEKSESKKADAKITRSAVARLLDELAVVYRARWQDSLHQESTLRAQAWAAGLDQIAKTRHYILRNANTNLALDVLFGRLIATHRIAP
jgi:DNA polymerase-3 subunit delta'